MRRNISYAFFERNGGKDEAVRERNYRNRQKSMERLKNYEKAIADILANVKKNKNKESGEE